MPLNRAWARFDDVRAGIAVAFDGPRLELAAHRPDEVVPVLAEVERLTDAGAWAVGFVAYEAAAGLDPTLAVREPVDGLPLVWFGICERPHAVEPVDLPSGPAPDWHWTPRWDAQRYTSAVESVRFRIAAGDTYQVNLTTRLDAPIAEDPALLYARLAHAQRGAHHSYLDLGRHVIAGASPELFFERRGDRILMRPMKGTAPRGRTLAEDEDAIATLLSSSKERAENVMIVDLVRNDLARIATTGSVRVTSLCRTERYETVHQLTSNVEAQLRPRTGLTEILRALFPCGSVTGAPKAATMGIIAELEDTPRGVYCGAVGVVGPPGSPIRARFNVAIRTVVADLVRGTASYGTGGGVTWTSDPAAEHAEALAKTAVLRPRPADLHLIETLRYEDGRGPVRLDHHLRRMGASAGYFGFRFRADDARTALQAELDRHPPGAGDARIRITAYRDGTVRASVGPAPLVTPGPVLLALDPEPIDSRECWPHHKTSRREPYEVRRARHATDDVLVVNERGEVTEACTANLAVLIDGRWWTPPLGSGCLPGIGRGILVASGVLAERTITPADLVEADGLAVVSSLRGWRTASLTADDRQPDERFVRR